MSPIVLSAIESDVPDRVVLESLPTEPSRLRRSAAQFFLQISHRSGAIALLALLGTWGMMFEYRDFHLPLSIAAGCADAGLCTALVARLLVPRNTPLRREARGVAIFNLVLFVLAIYLMVFARGAVIRSAVSDFFTPTPPAESPAATN